MKLNLDKQLVNLKGIPFETEKLSDVLANVLAMSTQGKPSRISLTFERIHRGNSARALGPDAVAVYQPSPERGSFRLIKNCAQGDER